MTVSFPAEMTVRKPIRGPSETRISPIEPEWASVATGPGTNVGCRLPIQGDGKPGVAMPMQFGPTMAMPAVAHAAPMIRSDDRRALGARLVAEAGRDDRPHALDREHVVDRRLDAAVADAHHDHLGHGRAVADGGDSSAPRRPRLLVGLMP